MSQVPARQRFTAAVAPARAARQLVAFFLLFAAAYGLGTAPAQAATSATMSAIAQQELCEAWTASSSKPTVTTSTGLTVQGTSRTRSGSSCFAPNASVQIGNADISPTGSSSPAGNAAARILAAVTQVAADDSVTNGTELFSNASISNIYAGFDSTGFYVAGTIRLAWSGGTNSYLAFKGSISGLNSFDVKINSPIGGTEFPNIGGSPLNFTGTLSNRNGVYSLNATGTADQIIIGSGDSQVTVKGADFTLGLKTGSDGSQGLTMHVNGEIDYGKNVQAQGSLDIDFDGSGVKSVTGGGKVTVQVPAKGSSPAGTITGDATVNYSPSGFTIGFAGEVRFGETLVANAKGTIDPNTITFTGDATVNNAKFTFTGAIDGIYEYGDNLAGTTIANRAGTQVAATKGDYLIKTASGSITAQGVTAKGAVQIGSVGDTNWVKGSGDVALSFKVGSQPQTDITGSATVDGIIGQIPDVTFSGSISSGSTTVLNAKGALNGQKIDFSGDATLSNPDLTIKGAVDGTVYYGNDLSGLTVKNHAGDTVAVGKGDFVLRTVSASINTNGFALAGSASLARVGGDRWATGFGTVDATYKGTKLSGTAGIDWVSGGTPTVTFSGAVSNGDFNAASVKGTVDGSKLTLSGTGQLKTNGLTITGAADGVVFYGDSLSGQKITGADGKDVQATQGDFLIKSATAKVSANGFDLTGNASVGSVGGTLWAKGGGSVDLTYGATNVKGSATASWSKGSTPAVGFSGTVTSGTTTVANASGTFDGTKLTVKGDASYTGNGVTVSGSADGVVYYGSDLSGEKITDRSGAQVTPVKGDFVLKTAATGTLTAKGLTLGGTVTISRVAGDVFVTGGGSVDLTYGDTKIKGSAQVAWVPGQDPTVTFSGSVTSGDTAVANVTGTADGAKITFKGDAALTAGGIALKGSAQGVVYYGKDLTGEKVTDHSGASVQAKQGDFAITAASAPIVINGITLAGGASISSVGGSKFVTASGDVNATYNGTLLKGSAKLDWVIGGTPAVTFSGSVSSADGLQTGTVTGTLDGKKLSLTGDATLSVAGISVKGAASGDVFYGSDLTGSTIVGSDGKAVQATKGDWLIKSASADVVAKGFTLKGAATIGSIGGKVFASGGGSVDLTYGSTNVKGSATASYTEGSAPTVSFSGSVASGTAVVANASGSFDGTKLTIKGDASYNDPNLPIKGAATGVLYYGPDLSGEKITNRAGAQVTPTKGDFTVTTTGSVDITVKNLTVNGNVTLSSVAGDLWVTGGGNVDLTYGDSHIKGAAQITWAAANASTVGFTGSVSVGDTAVANASGTIDGSKLTFTGDAALAVSGVSLKGSASGVVYYGKDLTGQKITNRSGAQVQAAQGDAFIKADTAPVTALGFTLTGGATAGSVGGTKFVTASGDVNGTFKGATIKGSAKLDWTPGTSPVLSFAGSVSTADGLAVASATGTIDSQKVSITGTASATIGGITVGGSVAGDVYYGSGLTGVKVNNHAGVATQVQQGDFLIKGASADIAAKGFTLKGNATVGKIGGELFATGGGSVDLTYGATNVKGSATADWVAGQSLPTVGFAGSVTSGTTVVAGASGTFDGKKLSVKGDASYTDPKLTLKGAVEGVVYYGSDLTGESVASHAGTQVQPKKGDFVLKGTAGASVVVKGITLSGGLVIASVGDDHWASASGSVNVTSGNTTIKGSASVDFTGTTNPVVNLTGSVTSGDLAAANVTGTIDGTKLTFSGDAAASNSSIGFKGAVSGVVFYGGDLSSEKITNHDGDQVTPKAGDLYVSGASATVTAKNVTVTGAAKFGYLGGVAWVTGGGSVDATYGTIQASGSASIDWQAPSAPKVTFSGTVSAGTMAVASAKGTFDGATLTFTGLAAYQGNGITLAGGVDAVAYIGNAAALKDVKVTDHDGNQVQASQGDIVIKTASGTATFKGVSVTGSASFGKVGTQTWIRAGGALEATYGSTALKGSASTDYVVGGPALVVNYTGSVTNGTTAVANVTGTLDSKKLTFKGDASLTDPNFTLSGAASGTVWYGSDLSGETVKNRAGATVQPAKGDFVLTSASGSAVVKGVTLAGNVSVSSVGGDLWVTGGGSVDFTYNGTKVSGSATVTWVKGSAPTVSFTGSVVSGDTAVASVTGSLDGNKLTFSGQAALSNATVSLKGAVDGVVFYGSDLSKETIVNHDGKTVTPAKGDWLIKSATATVQANGFTLTGGAQVGSVGSTKWVTGGGSVDLTYGSVGVKGSANVDYVLGSPSPAITFSGSLSSGDTTVASASGTIDSKKITFTGQGQVTNSGITVKGAVTGTLWYGSNLTGETIPNHAGTAVQAQKGDLYIKSVSADISAKGWTVSGAVSIGIDGSEKYAIGGGSVNLTFGSTKITGSANVDWVSGKVPSVAFSGGLVNGTTTVANASGTLDGNKVTLTGDASAVVSGATLTGSVSGVFFYGADLTGETVANRAGTNVVPLKGDYLFKGTAGVSAKGLTLGGGLQVGNVRGDFWATAGGTIDLSFGSPVTRIQGSAQLNADGSVAFSGTLTNGDTTANVSGTADGKKILFTGSLKNSIVSGNASGGVYYGADLTGETEVNRTGQTVAATRGDFWFNVTNGQVVLKQLTATANASFKKVGTAMWAKADAQIKVANTYLTFTGEVDNTGYVNLQGAGTADFNGTTVQFSGSATVVNGAVVISGGGTLTNGLFSATVTGTIAKPDMNTSQYVLTGTANFKFASYSIANATVRLTFGEGLTTAFSIKTCFFGIICPNATYKLYFTGATVTKIELNAPVAWAAQFLAIGAIAFPKADIKTTITGII